MLNRDTNKNHTVVGLGAPHWYIDVFEFLFILLLGIALLDIDCSCEVLLRCLTLCLYHAGEPVMPYWYVAQHSEAIHM